MKRNGVETTIPEFWFSGHIGVIWKLYVDNIIVLIVHNRASLRDNMLRG